MTNRQWIMWRLIDMSDEELVKEIPGFMCDICNEYITPHQICKGDCRPKLLAWLKKEHKEEEK